MPKPDHSSKLPSDSNLPPYIHSCFHTLEPCLNNSDKFQRAIFPLFLKEDNPLRFALSLVSHTRSFKRGRNTRLPIAILEALKEYCKSVNVSPLMTRKQKVEAFDVALLFTTATIYQLICQVFELRDEREYVLEMTRHLLTQKKYKEAYHTIAAFDLENEFAAEDCLFPLFFLGHESWVKAYLTKYEPLQCSFVMTLDSLGQSAFAIYEFLKSIGLEGLKQGNGMFDKRWIMKRLPAYAELFNVDIKSCPNLYHTRVSGAMHYLVRKMFIEESIVYEAFEEMVVDTVSRHFDVQTSLLRKLVTLGQTAVAIRIAKLLKVHKNYWPQPLQLEIDTDSDSFVYQAEPRYVDYLLMRMNRSDIIFIDKKDQFIVAVTDISENYDVVGVDAEWKPNLGIFKEKTALLQLATWDSIYLIDVAALNFNGMFATWNYMMKRIFCNPEILKLGYGISQDLKVLTKTLNYKSLWENYKYPLQVDLGDFFNKLKVNFPEIYDEIERWHTKSFVHSHDSKDSKGLSQVCRIVLGKALNKDEQFSNWERRPLRETQIIYAGLDAYCLLMIYEKLYPFLKKHNLTWENVLNSKKSSALPEKPKITVPPLGKVPISEFKVVVDHTVGGIVKFLRLLGADVICLDEQGDHLDAVEIALAQNRYIITSKANYKRVIGYFPKDMCYAVSPEIMPKVQVVNILETFGVECKDTDLFSRCTICNGSDYIKVDSKELFSHWNKIVGSECESKVKIGRKMNTVFTCDITDVEGTLHKDQSIKLAACNIHTPFFFICCKCGKVYWDGSHRSRYKNSVSEVLDIKCPQRSE